MFLRICLDVGENRKTPASLGVEHLSSSSHAVTTRWFQCPASYLLKRKNPLKLHRSTAINKLQHQPYPQYAVTPCVGTKKSLAWCYRHSTQLQCRPKHRHLFFFWLLHKDKCHLAWLSRTTHKSVALYTMDVTVDGTKYGLSCCAAWRNIFGRSLRV